MATILHLVQDDSSTRLELWGPVRRMACVIAVSSLLAALAGGQHRIMNDNLGCVHTTDGIVPRFAFCCLGTRVGELASTACAVPGRCLARRLFCDCALTTIRLDRRRS